MEDGVTLRCDQVPVVLSHSSRWAGQDHATAAMLPLGRLLGANSNLSVRDVVACAVRELGLHQPVDAIACTLVTATQDPAAAALHRQATTRRHVMVSPSAAADPSSNAVLKCLGARQWTHDAPGESPRVDEVLMVVLSDWEELKRNERVCSQPHSTAGGPAPTGGGSTTLFTSNRALAAASHDTVDALVGDTPRSALVFNPGGSTSRKRERLDVGASPRIDIPTERSVASPSGATGLRQQDGLTTGSPRVPMRTSLLEHPPTPAPPVADLATLNMWIQKHKLATWHVVQSLLCPVCGLMPVDPVVVPCCCATLCAACAAGKPSPNSMSGQRGGLGADGAKSLQQDAAAATENVVTCAHCGEERSSDARLLLANPERAASVARWAKELCVLYRDELTERAQGVLSGAPPRVLFPHQHHPHTYHSSAGMLPMASVGLPPPPPHLMMPQFNAHAFPPPPPQYGSPHSPHSSIGASFNTASPTGYR